MASAAAASAASPSETSEIPPPSQLSLQESLHLVQDAYGALRACDKTARDSQAMVRLLDARIAVARALERLQFHYPDALRARPDLYPALLSSASYSYAVRVVLGEAMPRDGVKVTADHLAALMLSAICTTVAAKQASRGTSAAIADAEAAFFVFGKARKERLLSAEVWENLFLACRELEVPASMFDAWLTEFENAAAADEITEATFELALHWCSLTNDVERAMRVWGLLMRRHRDRVPPTLKLCGAMLSVAQNMKHDGGFTRFVLETIKNDPHLGPERLRSASWEELGPLLRILTPQACIELIRFRLGKQQHDARIDLSIWIQLLRRLCHSAAIAEAESLFKFLCANYRLGERQKGMLVVLMMKMYALRLGRTPDFDGCNAVFQVHVVSAPHGQAQLRPLPTHYELLIAAAPDAETAQQVYIEACAEGVPVSKRTYQKLFAKEGQSPQSLSRRLPVPFEASPLDQSLRIPADVDAHAARDEAQRMRGKRRIVDSTVPI